MSDQDQNVSTTETSTSTMPPPPTPASNKYTIEEITVNKIESLREQFPSSNCPNTNRSGHLNIPYNSPLTEEDYVLGDITRKGNKSQVCEAYVRAGPRATTHFDPKDVRAAIISCGGLCPGVNNVIREVYFALKNLYNVNCVLGIRGGFNGMTDSRYEPFDLSTECVRDCHHLGGSILGSSRGGFDLPKMIDFINKHRINQLYIIGGDGTHRGANILGSECRRLNMNVAVVGIPKTVDNDVDLIDRSFGFDTSVEAAQPAIRSALCEAKCNIPNGIGIVKLMGRSAGFIAAHATIASGEVDLCLIPEIPTVLRGEGGYLPFLYQRVQEKGYAVVIIAEGAGEDVLGTSTIVDAGGNRKLPQIGDFMKDEISKYFEEQNDKATIKYIDPSYMVRSVPANSSDSYYCLVLGQNAVHGAMNGFTNFTTGLLNNRVVYIPISKVVKTSPRTLNPRGHTWERVLSITLQPQHYK